MHFPIVVAFSILALATSAFGSQTYICRDKKKGEEKGDDGIKLRLRPDKTSPTEIKAQACLDLNGGSAPFINYKDGDDIVTLEKVETVPSNSICEHIIEVQLVGESLKSAGGACEAYKQADEEGKKVVKAKVKQITDILNNKPNLIFAHNVIEKMKGDLVEVALAGEKLPLGNFPASTAHHLHAVDDYVNNKFKDTGNEVAAELDAKIMELFPGVSVKVVSQWNKVTEYAAIAFEDFEKVPKLAPFGFDLQAVIISVQGVFFGR